jgi:hypothetical protein
MKKVFTRTLLAAVLSTFLFAAGYSYYSHSYLARQSDDDATECTTTGQASRVNIKGISRHLLDFVK